MRWGPVAMGIASFLPGMERLRRRGTGGSDSARYCYSVWLRHLVRAQRCGALRRLPRTLAELGPGDSLGTGLAALLGGVETYYAFDVVRYADTRRNLAIFDELATLYHQRAPIPDEREFPGIVPRLKDYAFPSDLLPDAQLEAALAPERVAAIRQDLADLDARGGRTARLSYVVPWHDPAVLTEGGVEMILSQAVLEHVDDLPGAYEALRRWLAPGGVMTHTLDFGSHGITDKWNEHWAYPAWLWALVRGKRAFLINRQPWAVHREHLARSFRILTELPVRQEGGIARARLAAPFRAISDDDLATRAVFVAAVK